VRGAAPSAASTPSAPARAATRTCCAASPGVIGRAHRLTVQCDRKICRRRIPSLQNTVIVHDH